MDPVNNSTPERQIFTDSHAKSILATMNNLRKANRLCDVTLQVGEQDFPAHRIVLAACSDYFCAMFTHGVGSLLCYVYLERCIRILVCHAKGD